MTFVKPTNEFDPIDLELNIDWEIYECPDCHSSGIIEEFFEGNFEEYQCPNCNGSGHFAIYNPCQGSPLNEVLAEDDDDDKDFVVTKECFPKNFDNLDDIAF